MTIKTTRSDVALLLLAFGALVVPVLEVRREFFAPSTSVAQAWSSESETLEDSTWLELTSSGHSLGSRTAPITVVEFSDFQCPFCREWWVRSYAMLNQLRPNAVRVVYHHLPLPSIHPEALTAALASECAATMGSFERFHDFLFANQDRIGTGLWKEAASQSGITDTVAFAKCMTGTEALSGVQLDLDRASRLGVYATPMAWLNGQLLTTPLDTTIVDSALSAMGRRN